MTETAGEELVRRVGAYSPEQRTRAYAAMRAKVKTAEIDPAKAARLEKRIAQLEARFPAAR